MVIEKKDFKVLMMMPKFILTKEKSFSYMIPLGVCYIASTIKHHGFNIDCLNLNHREGSIQDIIGRELRGKNYDVICTALVGGPNYVLIDEVCKGIRMHSPKSKIVIGGALLTSEPEIMLESLGIEYGVLGEGEATIVELLDCIRTGGDHDKVNGIVYRDPNGKAKITEGRVAIEDVGSIPYPEMDGFEFSEYLKNIYCNQQFYNQSFDFPIPYPILSSRSCPFHCTFCHHSIGYKYRERSIDDVIAEIKMAIEKYKINVIAIYDDMFAYKKERLYEFCEKLTDLKKNVDWDVKWSCQLAVHDLSEDLLFTMKKSGCELISYGFESASEKVLRSMKKPITKKQIEFAIKTTMKAKIGIQGNFIFGDTAETNETVRETLQFWKEKCRGQVILGFIQPYAGSTIYKRCVEKKVIKDRLQFITDALEGKKIYNMTEEMTNKEMHDLANKVRYLRNLVKRVVPISVKKSDKKGYKVSLKCPYCKDICNYDNYYLQSRSLYKGWSYCRHCNMRFLVVSMLVRASEVSPKLSLVSEKGFRKVSNMIRVKNIKKSKFTNDRVYTHSPIEL
jgi:anaerobic magnesium-protoporphyrin IX monomethyl ester cyclase